MKSSQVIDHLLQNNIISCHPFNLSWKSSILMENVIDRVLLMNPIMLGTGGVSLDDYLAKNKNVPLPPGMNNNWRILGQYRKWELFLSRHLFESMKDEISPSLCLIEDSYSKGEGIYNVSVSHSRGVIRVALAKRDKIRYLGIDVEQSNRSALLDDRLWNKVSTENDRGILANSKLSNLEMRILLFSAKEALYKFAYPFYGNYFGFHEAELKSFSKDHLIFDSHVLSRIGQENIRVDYQITNQYIYSVALLTTA